MSELRAEYIYTEPVHTVAPLHEVPVSADSLYNNLEDGADLGLHVARPDLISIDEARRAREETDQRLASQREALPPSPEQYIASIGRNLAVLRRDHLEFVNRNAVAEGFEDLAA